MWTVQIEVGGSMAKEGGDVLASWELGARWEWELEEFEFGGPGRRVFRYYIGLRA